MRANTDWFRDARWGVFCHYLADEKLTPEQWNAQVDAVDVPALAAQLAEVNAPYIFLTLGQNSGHYCAPNAAYDRFVGLNPSKCSRRDLMLDLYDALQPHGVSLLAYLPAGAPDRDEAAKKALQWTNGRWTDYAYPDGPPAGEKPDDRNANFQRKWETVIAEWSQRWGRKVRGWWFDGCYFARAMYRHPEPPNFASFAAAAKAGNPDSLVAFNPGVKTPVICYTEHEDYTAGEISHALPVADMYSEFGKSRFVDGAQYHILSFIGQGWAAPPPRFTPEFVVEYTRFINQRQGVVTWDVPITPGGLIPDEFLPHLAALGKNIPRA